MQIEKIVINASPIILLCKSDLEFLLPQMFNEILVPYAVWDEVLYGHDLTAIKLHDCKWFQNIMLPVSEEVLVWNLGEGETEVLSWAFINKDYCAVIDDRAARNCARTLEIQTLGTGGVLVLAKRRGLIDSVGDSLKGLQNVGLYISDEIIELLKKQAGEK